jgi:hypothetical protein
MFVFTPRVMPAAQSEAAQQAAQIFNSYTGMRAAKGLHVEVAGQLIAQQWFSAVSA